MSSYTLLDYVQAIASSLDSDEVNSYSDSVESLQIANIVKTVYNDLQSRADLPEHFSVFELTASADVTKPVLMYRPTTAVSMEWVKYNKISYGDTAPLWREVTFMPIDEFMAYTYGFNVDDTEVESLTHTLLNGDTLTFIYHNDRSPQYYTTFDDHTLVFDAFDSAVDTTLQATKSLSYGRIDQAFTMNDSFVPFLDRDMSTLLLNEAKVLAFSELKQVGHDVARQWAHRGWTSLQKNKRGVDQNRNELDRAPNYGRRRR